MGRVARWAGYRGVRATVVGLTAVALVAALVLVGVRGGYSATRPRLGSGAAWLASSRVGQLTLLDGSSAEVAAQIQVAARDDRLDVVQQGAAAYVVNRSTGTVRRVDGATFEVAPAVTPIPDAREGLAAFAGSGVLYALDRPRGAVSTGNPGTGTGWGALVPTVRQVGVQAAALDDAGRLWVLDIPTGDVLWIERGRQHVRPGLVTARAGLLVPAGGAVVAVDTARRTAIRLDPDAQTRVGLTGLDLRPEDRIQLGGAPHADRIYLIAPGGLLDICDLTAGSCATAVSLGADSDLGTPVEAGGRVFVPDYATGQVWVVDLRQAKVIARPKVLDARIHYQLLARDGVVFFNDPDSERAGVIRLDGGVVAVAKYDPKDPTRGLTDPSARPSAPPSSPPPAPVASTAPTPSTVPVPRASGSPSVASSLQITVSKTVAQVGEDVTLRVSAVRGPAPATARWTFGDGGTATGLLTTHHWGTPQTYQVSVEATLPDGRTATTSVPIRVVAGPPRTGSLTVNVSGSGTVASQPAGVACPATCTATFPGGTPVRLIATPAAGAVFAGWTGGCADPTAPTCQVTVPAAGAVTLGATFQPAGPPVHCGDTITTNTTLSSDLSCPGGGLTIGAPGVTLDLGGHRITGSGAGNGVFSGMNNTTIRNGGITGFAVDVSLGQVGPGRPGPFTLDNLTLTGAGTGLRTKFIHDLTVRASRITGVVCGDTNIVTITGGTLTGNIGFGGSGTDVTITGTGTNGAAFSFSEVNNIRIADNTGAFEVFFMICFGVTIQHNTFQGGDIAIDIGAGRTTGVKILNNTISGYAIGLRAKLGFLDEAAGTEISGNGFSGNGAAGILIDVANARPTTPWSVSGNTFTGNGKSSGGLTDRAGHSVNDGLHLNLPPGQSITISGNTARNNGDYGIESVNPMSDGGTPNHASGNANPAQCTGLTCVP
jgi:uncharacterized repeat protein (TIGR02543 family)